jgi:L-ascorbate metabolism protein UlaG (beta-lactamase superfamily)
MEIEWLGQSGFRLAADGTTIVVDPLGDVAALAARGGLKLEYPPIEGVSADLVLVTHEHADHNGVEAIDAIRSSCGRPPAVYDRAGSSRCTTARTASTSSTPPTPSSSDGQRAAPADAGV